MKRREFLILTAGFGASAALSGKSLPAVSFPPDKRLGIDDHHWKVFDIALNHLFPAEANAPGASDVHATAWLHNALLMPDVDQKQRDFMRDGVIQLEKLSLQKEKSSFLQLSESQRESVLRQMEQEGDGRAWLQETLRYILEAALSDPVYGGNPNGIGWKWLQHIPGFPRPPKNKRYFLL